MRLPSNTTFEDFTRHHQPEPGSPLSWLIEKYEALQNERDRLVEALDAFADWQANAASVIERAVQEIDLDRPAEARTELDSIDTAGGDLPDIAEWCGS